MFLHYDSMNGSNEWIARQSIPRLAVFLQAAHPQFVPMDTSQQTNGYDCGVYVLATTKALVDRALNYDFGLTDKVGDLTWCKFHHSPEDIHATRVEISTYISELATQYD